MGELLNTAEHLGHRYANEHGEKELIRERAEKLEKLSTKDSVEYQHYTNSAMN